MICIFLTGTLCSGKTETHKTLNTYLTENGYRVAGIGPDTKTEIERNIYKTFYGQFDFMILDGVARNVFDRMHYIEVIKDAAKAAEIEVKFVAVNLVRYYNFIQKHNIRSYPNNEIFDSLSNYQIAIRQEGFDMIHAVRNSAYINMNSFINMCNKILKTELPPYAEPECGEDAEPLMSEQPDIEECNTTEGGLNNE